MGHPNTISVTIANSGPQPAYRVVAKLRSSVDALHGHRLDFGRIDPGKAAIRSLVVTVPPNLDDRSALVVAEISYFNGESFEIRRRLDIRSEAEQTHLPRSLAADCRLAGAEIVAGGRLRIDCVIRNLGRDPVNGMSASASIAGVTFQALVPQSLPAGWLVNVELGGLAPANLTQGADVPVLVRIGAPGIQSVHHTLSVRIASFATKCQTRLTRDEYKAARKKLQSALSSGALTQKEFDKYDADLVSCLQ